MAELLDASKEFFNKVAKTIKDSSGREYQIEEGPNNTVKYFKIPGQEECK